LAAAIEAAHPGAKVELVKGGKGDFIVTRRDGERRELWNKRAKDGGFPEHQQILEQL